MFLLPNLALNTVVAQTSASGFVHLIDSSSSVLLSLLLAVLNDIAALSASPTGALAKNKSVDNANAADRSLLNLPART